MSLDKYIHSVVEDEIYLYWEKNNLFKPKKEKILQILNNISKFEKVG